MQRLKSVRFWRKIAIGYWTLYGRLHRGWRKAYAGYAIRRNRNKKEWKAEKKQFEEIMRKYHPELLRQGKLPRSRLFDFWLCYAFLGALSASNYFHFQFHRHRDWGYRRKSVTNLKTWFASEYLNTPEAVALTKSKLLSAAQWPDWYKRDCCGVSAEKPVTAEELRRVRGGADRLIVKPDDDYGGHGIFVLDAADDGQLEAAAAQLNVLQKAHIVEPYIRQTGLLHELNPSSVNTVRAITGRHADGGIEVMLSYCRIGHAGSIVDNATSGGQLFFIDHRDGRIGEGMDFKGRCFREHLDSGETITGLQIPHWQEFLEFCISAHRYAPEGLRLAAWDVCVSDDGFTLLEVNVSPALSAPLPWFQDPWRAVRKLLEERDACGAI